MSEPGVVTFKNMTMRRARKLHRAHRRAHGAVSFRHWARTQWPPHAARLMLSPKLAAIVRGVQP